MSPNANNPIIALPVEILQAIFVFCTEGPDLNPDIRGHKYPPSWVAITYVCRHWRIVALGYKKLWSSITPDLSPDWIVAFLQRSSYTPTHVNIDVGPPLKKPPKKYRLSIRRRPVKKPSLMLHGEMVEEIFSHASRVEILRLEGNTADVIRTLASLGGSIPLVSLSLSIWDGCEYLPVESDSEDQLVDPSLILPENFLGNSAPRLSRLHCRSSLHITFPSWMLGTISEFAVTCSFCDERLFAALRQMPRLEVLRILPRAQYGSFFEMDELMSPVHLNNLSLLVFDDTGLGLLIALLGCLLAPGSVRKHFKLKLDESNFDDYRWERFTSLMCSTTAVAAGPLHGIHFRREPLNTTIRAWVSPADSGLPPSPWPPLDDPFSLEIHCADHSCLYGLHTSYSISAFHRIQEFCVTLGGETVEELFVEYGTEPGGCRRPEIPHVCWRPLFSGLSSLKTLRFGDGAAEVLAAASYGSIISPPSTADGAEYRTLLSRDLQRVIIGGAAFSTRILWNWIHYAFVRPAQVDVSLLRRNVLALLWEPRWKSADINFVEDVTESLLIFLLNCRSMDVLVSDISLVEPTWDEPGGLEILRRLLVILDPDLNPILEPISSE